MKNDLYSQAKCDKALKKLIKWTKNYNKRKSIIKGLDEIDVDKAMDYLLEGDIRCDLYFDYFYLIGNKVRCDIQDNDSKLKQSIAELDKYRHQIYGESDGRHD